MCMCVCVCVCVCVVCAYRVCANGVGASTLTTGELLTDGLLHEIGRDLVDGVCAVTQIVHLGAKGRPVFYLSNNVPLCKFG